MSITKKSNIRSRWYRANEKPLESGTNPQINEPKGEISISEDEKLVDDLSSAKPPPAKQQGEKRTHNQQRKNRNRNNNERKHRRDKDSQRNENSRNKDSGSKNDHKRNSKRRNSGENEVKR